MQFSVHNKAIKNLIPLLEGMYTIIAFVYTSIVCKYYGTVFKISLFDSGDIINTPWRPSLWAVNDFPYLTSQPIKGLYFKYRAVLFVVRVLPLVDKEERGHCR